MMGNRYSIICTLGGLVFIIDQLTKMLIMDMVPLYASIPVINGFFDIIHIRNRGAAFGFLNRSDIEWQLWLFMGAAMIAVIVIFFLAYTADKREHLLFLGLGFIFGGALGNVTDRIRLNEVVDFLDFYVGSWHWPAFNVADIAICCGGVLVVFSMVYKHKLEEPIKP